MRKVLVGALVAPLWLLPALASAEERDPGEIVHAIAFVGLFTIFFVIVLSIGIWLLVLGLRNARATAPAKSSEAVVRQPDLERLWFPRDERRDVTLAKPNGP